MANFELVQTALVTGGTRNIGKEIALYLAKASWLKFGDHAPESTNYPAVNVIFGHRNNTDNQQRKNANMIDAIHEAGADAVAIHGDLTVPRERARFVELAGRWAARTEGIDFLVLNAAGGLEEGAPEGYGTLVNDTAQVALVDELSEYMKPDATTLLLESSWSELYPDLAGPVIPGYRENVSSTKRAGRDHVMELVAERFVPLGGRALVLAAGVVERTAIAKGFEEYYPETHREQQELGNIVTMKEVAQAAARILHDRSLPHGHVEWVGASPDVLLARYPV